MSINSVMTEILVVGSVTDFAEALSRLSWPIFAFWLVYLFKGQIRDAFGRLHKVRVFGQEAELRTVQLGLSNEIRPRESDAEDGGESQRGGTERENTVESIIHEAARSPKAALILLVEEIEKEARHILASVGKLHGRSYVTIDQAMKDLDLHYGLPRHVSSSLHVFRTTGEGVLYGVETKESNAFAAIDLGLTILKSLQALPRELNTIYRTDVPIYSDSECTIEIADAKGIILESRSAGGVSRSHRIFPTTREHFEVGKRVAWEWNMKNIWRDAWYRDGSESGAIKLAWNSSAEFIGRHLEEL